MKTNSILKKTNNNGQSVILIVFAFLSIYIIWGSTYLLNKIAVKEIAPLLLASIRFSISAILMLTLSKIFGLSIKINIKQAINCCIAGFLFLGFGNGALVWALQYIDSSLAALQTSLQPLVVLILMRIIDGKKIGFLSFIGVVFGFLGMFLLVNQEEIITNEESYKAMIMIFICMIGWGVASLFVKKAELPDNSFVNTAYQMLFASVFLIIGSVLFKEEWSSPSQWTDPAKISLIILIVFGSIVAFTSFNYLLQVVSPEKVSTSNYVNPIVAIILGWYFLDENITSQTIIASFVLLIGVFFINSKKKIILFQSYKGKLKK
ncbi:MAG: EamA family transporter [Flavobacteriaceae bacterium]|nr:EamA family transporter [Flavobacteriaceae bacterium]|tara:strand:- start:2327 stop:3286 length:960 start_codon:yes stop_codon:yes gene_type:complete